MKRLLMIALVSLIFTTCFAQARENRANLEWGSSSKKLKKATGWAYNESIGEWIDYANMLMPDTDYKDKYKSLAGAYAQSKTSSDFLWMQSRLLDFEGETFVIVLREQWAGHYNYPSIQEDWVEYKQLHGYAIRLEEFKKLLDIDGRISIPIYKAANVSHGIKADRLKELLEKLQVELGKPTNEYFRPGDWNLLLSEEGMIRFLMPGAKKPYGGELFEKEYFEVTPAEFNVLTEFE